MFRKSTKCFSKEQFKQTGKMNTSSKKMPLYSKDISTVLWKYVVWMTDLFMHIYIYMHTHTHTHTHTKDSLFECTEIRDRTEPQQKLLFYLKLAFLGIASNL